MPASRASSIAVLAFADMSPGKDQEYFSDGIAEEILNALGQVEGLRVIGRTSSFSFKGKSADLRTIGQELNVGTVLEGSVRKAGDRVRITTQLISSADGTHLWSETYDRNLTEVFAVQDEIARAVVAALKLKLLPARAESPTANPEAHNQFLLGLHFFQQGSSDGNARALEALEKAVALDPGFARGWAKLSTVRFVNADQNWAQYPPERFFPAALEAADKAIALAPSEAMGWVARGAFRTNWSKDWAAARSDLERALALAPDNADVLTSYGVLLSTLGQLPQAIAAVRKAAAVDPLRDRTWNQLAHYQLGTGEFDQAEANAARAVQLAPNSARSLRTLGFARLLQHKLDGAWTAFDSEKDDGASGTLYRLMGAALVEQDKGNKAESQRLVDEIIRKPFAVSASYQIAQVLAWQGQADRAFEWLERAYEQHDAGLNFLKYDPLLRNLRGDPRYTELLKKMKLPLD